MVACALTGNISGEAMNPLGNILREAMRQRALATAASRPSVLRVPLGISANYLAPSPPFHARK
jgi:hypothetical protein